MCNNNLEKNKATQELLGFVHTTGKTFNNLIFTFFSGDIKNINLLKENQAKGNPVKD